MLVFLLFLAVKAQKVNEIVLEIRKGNYRHFAEVERDIDIPLLPPQEEIDKEYQSYDPMPLTEVLCNAVISLFIHFTPFQYFGLFFSTDIDTVLEITDIRFRRKKAFILKVKAFKFELGFYLIAYLY